MSSCQPAHAIPATSATATTIADESAHRDEGRARTSTPRRGGRADRRRRDGGDVIERGPDHRGEGCRVGHPGHAACTRRGDHGSRHDVVDPARNRRTHLRGRKDDLAVARCGGCRHGSVAGPVAGGQQVDERAERVDVGLLPVRQVGQWSEQGSVHRQAAHAHLARIGDEHARRPQSSVRHVLPPARGDGPRDLGHQGQRLRGGEGSPVPVLRGCARGCVRSPTRSRRRRGPGRSRWPTGRGCRARAGGDGRRRARLPARRRGRPGPAGRPRRAPASRPGGRGSRRSRATGRRPRGRCRAPGPA